MCKVVAVDAPSFVDPSKRSCKGTARCDAGSRAGEHSDSFLNGHGWEIRLESVSPERQLLEPEVPEGW